jgi:hypothetical protein
MLDAKKLLAAMALAGVNRKELAKLRDLSKNTIGEKIAGRGSFTVP